MKRKIKRLVAALMAVITMVNILPATAFAAPASDIPDEMADNVLLDALAYTGYDVQSQKNDGTLFINYGGSTPSSVLSNIGYASSGSTSATGLETNSEGLPDIAYMEERGTQCGGYVSYVLFNYLPNVEGIDTSHLVQPQWPLSPGSYQEAANQWVADGHAEKIYEATGGTNFSYTGEIPIGSLIIMAGPTDDGSYSVWNAGHVCLYAGYYNGKHFITHVGNSRGPEINTIEAMQGYSGGDGKGYRFVIAIYKFNSDFLQDEGFIEVNKKDPNGKNLSGAVFTATNNESGKSYVIGPTDNKGYAMSEELPYGTYTVKETVFPTDYEASGPTSWTVTVSKDNNGKVTINAVNKLKTGYIDILKKDEDTSERIQGAVFGIYSDSACTKLVEELTTNANGYAKSSKLTIGTYYVKEITAAPGYVVSSNKVTVVVKSDETTRVNETNKEQLASITICKEGEVLAGWNGTNFTYLTQRIEGVTFKLTAGEDIYRADGTKAYSKGAVVNSNLKTGSDGKVVVSDLHLGTYVVTETKSVPGFTLNTTPKTIKIEYSDQTVEVVYKATTVSNVRQKATVTVEKVDNDTKNPLTGGQYTIYAGNDIKNYQGTVIVNKGTALQTVTTGSNGTATYSVDLPINNNYYVSETKAPANYVRNSNDVYNFKFDYLSENTAKATFTHTFANDRVTASLSLIKKDGETGTAQGDATLEGAVYGLYARNNINHPDGATGVIYKADALVTTLTTDKDGKASVSNLYLGNYYVKEIKASKGYLLDPTEYDLTYGYQGDLTANISKTTTVKETVKKQPFQLIKIAVNGSDTEGELLESAGFSAYLKSSLSVDKNGDYLFDSASPVVIGSNGETTLYTDKKGYLVTIPLPYGTYIVRETVVPHNMKAIKPFEVVISENNPTEPQPWRVFMDEEFTAKLRIIKKDAKYNTTVLVPNTEFKIYDMNNKKYVTMVTTYPSKVEHTSFFTDEDGDLILPAALVVGRYRIEEVKAPEGYLVNNNYVIIDVDSDTAHKMDSDTNDAIITVEYEDTPVVGEISLEKKGEVLTGYIDGEFVYEEKGLANAEYEVRAAEDIFTPDNQKDENGNRIKIYSKGDKVATIITDESGKASITDLPLGTYEVFEVKSPFGYVINEEVKTVTLEYADDKTEIVYESVSFINERQKVELSVLKFDGETLLPLSGVEFGVVNAKDIVDNAGNVIVDAGTLIETVKSDEEGNVIFTKDFPLGEYEVRELERVPGYITNNDIVVFDATYQGQEVEVIKLTDTFYNTPITFEFTKTDITSGVEIAGATLEVLDKEGNVIDSWVSVQGESHVIKRLIVGETYTLRETMAPYGYLIANEITFTVEDTGEVQIVIMEDEVPKAGFVIYKCGEKVNGYENGKFIYESVPLQNVAFEIYAARDIVSPDGNNTVYYEKDELIATIETDENGKAVLDNLPFGLYYAVEVKTADGFIISSERIDIDLEYVDQYTALIEEELAITNDRQKLFVSVLKKDMKSKEVLAGAVFGLYAKEDIVDVAGNTIVEADALIEEAVSDEEGMAYFVSDLPLGNYYVIEHDAPEGYIKSHKMYELDGTYQGAEVETIELVAEIENDITKVKICKTDITGEYELKGATLSVYDINGNLIETWISDGYPHYIERLPVGKYVLREESAPKGYLVASDVEFEVTETYEIQEVRMVDDARKGQVVIYKTDKTTGAALSDVEFEIRDKEGNVLETLVTDENGYAKSGLLDIAVFENGEYKADMKYFLVETKTKDGYVLDKTEYEIVFDGEKDMDVIEVVFNITNKPDIPDVPEEPPKTGDNSRPWMYIGLAIMSLITILGLTVGKKKRKI